MMNDKEKVLEGGGMSSGINKILHEYSKLGLTVQVIDVGESYETFITKAKLKAIAEAKVKAALKTSAKRPLKMLRIDR